ncbi:hypothetical protein BBJ28_00025988 [Nothophytophthora sp. Chile5]|nr:hypothetical protein BBJ28_00025988 [Nothophytophthora sp. Chile5]
MVASPSGSDAAASRNPSPPAISAPLGSAVESAVSTAVPPSVQQPSGSVSAVEEASQPDLAATTSWADAAAVSTFPMAPMSSSGNIHSATSAPSRSGPTGPAGLSISTSPVPTSALDLLSSASSTLAPPEIVSSSPSTLRVPTAAGSALGSAEASTTSSTAMASDCPDGAGALMSLPTLEPYHGPSLSREQITAALDQSHLLQMLDHDCRQLEGMNAALVRQNRTLSDHVAALHAQNLQQAAAVEANRDRDHAAAVRQQQSARYLESWWEAEEELEQLVQDLHDVRESNDDLSGQLSRLRRTSDVAYRDLQEELWSEQAIVRRLSRDLSERPRVDAGGSHPSAPTPSVPESTSVVPTPASLRRVSPIPAVITAVLSFLEPPALPASAHTAPTPVQPTPASAVSLRTSPAASPLAQQLVQAQEAERRARNAAEQASSRRELAEKVAAGAERFVLALRGELAAANARGDGYKSSFDHTVEQRKADAATAAQRCAVLGTSLLNSPCQRSSGINIHLCHFRSWWQSRS